MSEWENDERPPCGLTADEAVRLRQQALAALATVNRARDEVQRVYLQLSLHVDRDRISEGK